MPIIINNYFSKLIALYAVKYPTAKTTAKYITD